MANCGIGKSKSEEELFDFCPPEALEQEPDHLSPEDQKTGDGDATLPPAAATDKPLSQTLKFKLVRRSKPSKEGTSVKPERFKVKTLDTDDVSGGVHKPGNDDDDTVGGAGGGK
ncbi:hypothetical protein Nepgr_001302 [Nepenthes gracilis]|uniref:Uncharacterized protein n=1 Tax=Nepenthes gracilis TaxID=150966 RepID=A0AAD3RXG9_NEPGR|nr:hypothetical protein Nepgr_001302 [Nepenthes gracilis]